MTDKLSPIHPGEVLLEEFIKPMNLSQNRLAIEIGVDARRINEIVLGKRSVTADSALRLSRFFGHLKEEYLRHFKKPTFKEMEQLIDEYIYFYNYERLQLKTRQTPYETRCLSS